MKLTYNADIMVAKMTRDGPGRPALSVQEKLKRVSARIPPESEAIILETAAQAQRKGGALIRYLLESALHSGLHLQFLRENLDTNAETT